MEFGIFVQGHSPGQEKAHSQAYAADWVKRELELIQAADKHNFKYVWVTEHHFLEEYSHLSDSATFIAYALAKTERIHIGSGIFNMNPVVNHPARLAERVAMLDLLSQGRSSSGRAAARGATRSAASVSTPTRRATTGRRPSAKSPRMWRQKGLLPPRRQGPSRCRRRARR